MTYRVRRKNDPAACVVLGREERSVGSPEIGDIRFLGLGNFVFQDVDAFGLEDDP